MKNIGKRLLAIALGIAIGTCIDLGYTAVTTTSAANPSDNIVGGSINNTPIGATTPSTGAFTTLNASGLLSTTAGYQFRGADNTGYELLRYVGGTNNVGLFAKTVESTRDVQVVASGSNTPLLLSFYVGSTLQGYFANNAWNAKATPTNDSAAAGYIGEYQEVNCGIPAASGASVAFTNASPTVGTWTAHPFQKTGVAFGSYACPFTITATAPTGLSTATNYWATPIDANTFHVSTSAANAAAGTWANTTGSTAASNLTNSIALSTTAGLSPAVLLLTAGDWDCSGQAIRVLGATTSVTNMQTGINSASTTIGGFGTYFDFESAANVMTATNSPIHSTPTVRLSLASTTAEYLVALDTFTASTNTVSGFLRCRRMR